MLTIKICGLTNLDDARGAIESGADYLGFVLYQNSPRCVSVKELSRLTDALPEQIRKVGVFVNEAPVLVKEVAKVCGLSAVQLHGDEPPGDYDDLGVTLWRALRLQGGKWNPDFRKWAAERFVLDADSRAYGGTGMTVDWDAAGVFANQHRVMLAGGLTVDNVGDAVRCVRPLGVDVSSGVELAPGRKDHKKMAAFIRAARAADEALRSES
jgi:phosphoribosylanthranilate isomerase